MKTGKRTLLKRTISFLIVFILIFGLAPLGATVCSDLFFVKASAVTYSGICGEGLTWTLDTETGELVISGTGDMTNWSSYSYVPWYSECLYIKTVTIESGVTSIGDYAFFCCEILTSVTIPDSVTSIGDGAFTECFSLTSVTIPDSVTNIGDEVFIYCYALTNVTIPDSVTSIGNDVFYECHSLESVIIPDSVTSIGDAAFCGCGSLETVTIPDSVTSIGADAFWGCKSLTSVTIGNSVTSIGDGAFGSCDSLTNVTISDSVTSIGDYAFRYSDNLKTVYYKGTQEQWEKISIGSFNESLRNATIHYREIVDVVVKGDSVKTEYIYKRDNIDISGIELEVTYSDGTKDIIKDTSAMTVSGFSNEKTGEQSVTVEYEGLKAEYKVTVKYTWWQWILVILLFGWIWY